MNIDKWIEDNSEKAGDCRSYDKVIDVLSLRELLQTHALVEKWRIQELLSNDTICSCLSDEQFEYFEAMLSDKPTTNN